MNRNLRAVAVVASTTLREALRNRILIVSLAFAIGVVALSVAAAAVSIGDRGRLIIDVGLAAASALGSIIAIALGVVSFGRELERHTAYPVLARPLPRWAFVLGKYAGVLATVSIVVTLMIAATVLTVWLNASKVPGAVWSSLVLAWLEVGVVASVALFFSSFSGPVLASTFAAGVVLAGNFVGALRSLADKLDAQGADGAALLLRVVHHLLPDVELLSVRSQAANALPVPGGFLGWALVYSVVYSGAVLALAMVVFERRRAV